MVKASVLITVYNCEKYILASVASILAQTVKDIELVIVNDGSTDRTGELIDQIADPRLRVRHCERLGRARALNLGIDLCVSPLIAILDADDISLPDRIEAQIEFLSHRPRFALIGSRYRPIIDADGRPIKEIVLPLGSPGFARLLKEGRCPLFHSSVMFRKSIVSDLGGYDESLTHKLDLDLYVRLLRSSATPNMANMDRRLSLKRVHDDQYFGRDKGIRTTPAGIATTELLKRRIAEAIG